MASKKSPQLEFWRGAFGDDYIERNPLNEATVRARVAMWMRILKPLEGRPLDSILEVGANIGVNLAALRQLTAARLYALEPNEKARAQLVAGGLVPAANALGGSADMIALDDGAVDLAFTSGVLIHIAPENLAAACREMHRVARRYIACVEYFSTAPEEIVYRGHAGRLFKRDFGGFWLDQFPDLRPLDYGFFWRRTTGLDDLTWWLFEKPAVP
jgi:pseudaminic acid biosynthesis-associated methylase